MRVIVVLRSEPSLIAAATAAAPGILSTHALGSLPSLQLDKSFAPVQLPTKQGMTFSTAAQDSSYVVRGEVPDDDPASVLALTARADVVGVFSDPNIESTLICPGSPALGQVSDVSALLGVSKLQAVGMDGTGVHVAIVDSGINVAHLSMKGRQQTVDAALSSTPAGVPTQPGAHPVDHGTMCAYDTGIAAPKATLLDHAVLLSNTTGATVMSGLLSDAIRSYSVLLTMMLTPSNPARRLVVNNSWGMFDPKWDFPVGHPGNYSDNPLHPFNVIVGTLEAAGADILFAAGNCGVDCPDGRCAFGTTQPICGANSHAAVLSVAGVDVTKTRVGYSSQGPGRLSNQKPDLSAYTHFVGSEAFGVASADSGTSAACPVLAGVVAAVRTKHSPATLSPVQLRALLQKTAEDKGGVGFDSDFGWGIVNVSALLAQLPSGGGAGPSPAPAWPGRFFKFPPVTEGPDVVIWQRRMAERGFSLTVDGKYGQKSKAACQALQQQKGLTVDGIVGPKVWAATWS
jgi:subtilisin family serine protease